MLSLTKNRQSKSAIQRMAQRAFPDWDVWNIAEMEQGLFNAAYQMTFQNGRKTVLKIAPTPQTPVMRYEKGIMRAEVAAMRLVRQYTDVPVPSVYFEDFSHTICEADYFFMEFLEGERFDQKKAGLPKEETRKLEISMGRYNSQINRITGRKFGYLAQPEKQRASWKEAFLLLVDDLLQDGEEHSVSLPLSYRELRAVFQSYSDCFREVTQPCLVHWDLWDGNVLIKDGRISGILDLERALWGDPLMEYYFSGQYDNAAFLQGYGQTPALSPRAETRRSLYNLYLYLVMMIEYAFRGYEDQSQKIWAERKLRKELKRLKAL